jgi:hypothetical protein
MATGTSLAWHQTAKSYGANSLDYLSRPNAISSAIECAKHRSRSHDAVIHVYGDTGNVIETHEYSGDFKEPVNRNLTILQS